MQKAEYFNSSVSQNNYRSPLFFGNLVDARHDCKPIKSLVFATDTICMKKATNTAKSRKKYEQDNTLSIVKQRDFEKNNGYNRRGEE